MTEKTLEARRPAKRSSFKVTKTGKAAVPITFSSRDKHKGTGDNN